MNNPTWLKNAIFYEIYPQSFYDSNGDGIGDIEGIIEKLEYVKGLGCNAIWLNPCFDSPFMDGGYDVRNYKLVAARYGTNEDLERLFKIAHSKDMKILLDLVPGHTSDTHEWFKKSGLDEKNEYSDRYIWTDGGRPADFPAVAGMAERDACYLLNYFNSQPALNYGFKQRTANWQKHYTDPACVATFDAMLDVMRFWLNKGCDGFRVDMADSLVKNDDDKMATASIWQRARKLLDAEYPEAVLVSEWCNPPRAINDAGFNVDFYLDHGWNGGNGYHKLMRNYDNSSGADNSYFSRKAGGNINDFLDEYMSWYNKTKDNGYIAFITCNHDMPRATYNLTDTEIRLSYAFLFTMPGTPFLYYGDEIGMNYLDLKSKEGGYKRTGSRTPMQWNNDKNAGFSTADDALLYLPVDKTATAPNVAAQENNPDSLLNFVKTIIALRRNNADLGADADFEPLSTDNNGYPFVYRRGKLVCAVNPSGETFSAPIPTELSGKILFSINNPTIDKNIVTLPPQSFIIIE